MNHREAIGGMWDEIGDLQFNFVKEKGLKPEGYILDIGCGALRGGVRFINYLDDYHYFALEKEREILDKGIKNELEDGDDTKFNYNLTGDFEIPEDWPMFDYMLAQSVFTHLLPEQMIDCLEKAKVKLAKGGKFYATYFDSKENDHGKPHGWRSNERDFARYPSEFLIKIGEEAGLKAVNIGGWQHPRDQKMMEYSLA